MVTSPWRTIADVDTRELLELGAWDYLNTLHMARRMATIASDLHLDRKPGQVTPDSAQVPDGMRRVVGLLIDLGFDPVDAGLDHRDETEIEVNDGYPIPYVVLDVAPGLLALEASRLADILTRHGMVLHAVQPDQHYEHGGQVIEARYDPHVGIATITIFNVSDDLADDWNRDEQELVGVPQRLITPPR